MIKQREGYLFNGMLNLNNHSNPNFGCQDRFYKDRFYLGGKSVRASLVQMDTLLTFGTSVQPHLDVTTCLHTLCRCRMCSSGSGVRLFCRGFIPTTRHDKGKANQGDG
jgi:hypothetical protein